MRRAAGSFRRGGVSACACIGVVSARAGVRHGASKLRRKSSKLPSAGRRAAGLARQPALSLSLSDDDPSVICLPLQPHQLRAVAFHLQLLNFAASASSERTAAFLLRRCSAHGRTTAPNGCRSKRLPAKTASGQNVFVVIKLYIICSECVENELQIY